MVRAAVRSVLTESPADGPIWAVTMVRNEADVVEETIINLIDQGVDVILVADHLSTDTTSAALAELSTRYPVHVVRDTAEPFWQADKVTRLARMATTRGAAWIVPFDADEIWRSAVRERRWPRPCVERRHRSSRPTGSSTSRSSRRASRSSIVSRTG
jgi:D-serine deaminase-like pyridoxal phosphate-dependent protein